MRLAFRHWELFHFKMDVPEKTMMPDPARQRLSEQRIRVRMAAGTCLATVDGIQRVALHTTVLVFRV
jgi:hypothetical protein